MNEANNLIKKIDVNFQYFLRFLSIKKLFFVKFKGETTNFEFCFKENFVMDSVKSIRMC